MNLRRVRFALILYVLFDLYIGGHCAGLFPLSELAAAQFTTVTGTVLDPTGLPYANGTIVPLLVLPGGASATLNGLPYTPPTQPIGLDNNGKFLMQLADNTVLLPASTKWNFKVCSATGTELPAGGKGPVCFTLPAAITISGTSQDITANLAAAAVPISVSAGTNAQTGIPLNGLVIEYRMLPSETSTTVLTDSSGNNNNGTFPGGGNNPTRIAGTGGLTFLGSSSQIVTLPQAANTCTSFLFGYNYSIQAGATANGVTSMMQMNPINPSTSIGSYGFQNLGGAVQNAHRQNWLYVMGIGGFTGGDGTSSVINSGQGTHTLVFASTVGQLDHIYLDGAEDTYYAAQATTTSAARFNPQVVPFSWQLGGGPTFTDFFTGNLYYFACWNRQLSASEAAQANLVVTQSMNQRGILTPVAGTTTIPNPGTNNGQDVAVFDGDSITQGAQDTTQGITSWPMNVAINSPNFQVYVPAAAGTFLVTQEGPLGGPAVDNLYNAVATRNVYYQGGGHNDLAPNTVPAIESALTAVCKGRRLKGFKTVVATQVSSSGGAGGPRLQFDTWIKQHWSEFSDGMVDLASDPSLGCDTCQANVNLFPDGTHPSIYLATFQQYYAQRAINRLFGPQDFSAATIYVAAAAAATTVTAATDSSQIGTSGQSTATYTFASNPFTVGQLVTCTGITPGGYNQTLVVATSTATQITGIIPTASLGAGTVFGSCTAPQIEDKYALLNFGAGNANISSACAYTGQRIYLKNINAAGSTITTSQVPTEAAEQIDGAATLAIAANQVRILESFMVTPAAPQCGWRVIQ